MKKLFNIHNRYLKTTVVSFSIWLTAIVINALLFIFFAVIQGAKNDIWEGVGFVFLFSAVYSLPGIVVFWLLYVLSFRHRKLYSIPLITASITSFLSVLLLLVVLPGSAAVLSIPLYLMAMLSAIIAVGLHQAAISDGEKIDTNEIKKVESLET